MAKGQHQYKVTEVAEGCIEYTQGEEVMVIVDEPPPDTYQVPEGKPCAGTIMLLDEDVDE